MPQDLQSGDQVTISAIDSGGGRLLAQNVSVNRSISSGGTTQSSSYATVRGTVRSVDTGSRTIQLDQTSWTSGFVGDNSGIIVSGYTMMREALKRTPWVTLQTVLFPSKTE